jgi:heat shock protein 90kDa beta
MGLTAQQEKLMIYQNAGKEPDMMSKFYLDQKKILEINPKHPLMKSLLKKVQAGATDSLQNLPPALYEVYAVTSGYEPKSMTIFSERVEKIFRDLVGVDLDEKVDESHIRKSQKEKAKKVEKKEQVTQDDEDDHDEL